MIEIHRFDLSTADGEDFLANVSTSWYLESPGSTGEKLRVAVHPLPFRVGRGSDSDLVLDSRHGSQRHAELFLRAGALWLRDLGSTNGTRVNGRRISLEDRIESGDVLRFGDCEFRLLAEETAPLLQQTQVFTATDRLRIEESVRQPRAFRKMLRDGTLGPVFQPLIRFADRRTFGYEVLGRGELDGRAASAGELFFIAEKLRQEIELSATFRARGLELAAGLEGDPVIFINSHPAEIADPGLLLRSLELLRKRHPSTRLTLEVHEAAVVDLSALRELRFGLDALDVALAFDDFGRGQSRLMELDEIAPNYLKFDADLIAGLDLEANRQRRTLVGSLVRLAREMAVVPIAECIETAEEAAACAELGFELGQGFYFGVPAPPPEPAG